MLLAFGNGDGRNNFFYDFRSDVEFAGETDFENRAGDVLDVIRSDKVASVQVGARLSDPLPGQQATGAEAKKHFWVLARSAA